jgi:hypothetical protein
MQFSSVGLEGILVKLEDILQQAGRAGETLAIRHATWAAWSARDISVRESQPDVARDVALRVSDAVKLRQSILKELSLGCLVVLNEIRENERSWPFVKEEVARVGHVDQDLLHCSGFAGGSGILANHNNPDHAVLLLRPACRGS